MRVLVSGGTGLIGRALVRRLGDGGHEVAVLTRGAGDLEAVPRRVHWDGRDLGDWVSFVDGADAVIHLAGESIAEGRWTALKKQRILDSRVHSTEALIEAIVEAKARPKVLLQGSAVGWYGSTGDAELDESSPPGDDFLAEVCRAWETASARVEALGVRRPVLRTGVVLARDGGALPKMVLPFRLFAGGPVGNGRQWVPWIHLADEVGAIVHLLETESATGPFNLTAPEPLTNRDFAKRIGEVLHRPSFMPAPGFALKLALGEMADLLLGGQRALPKRLLESGYDFQFPDAASALRDLLD